MVWYDTVYVFVSKVKKISPPAFDNCFFSALELAAI